MTIPTHEHRGHDDHGGYDRPPHHRPHDPPYDDPDYGHPPDHPHDPPANPSYPDRRIYGDYAARRPPRYVPHPFEHSCFKPRKDDYKPPVTCDGNGDADVCVRKDHRILTVDEQNRFLNAFTQINSIGALGPLVDIHSNAIHQMHSNPRFLPWHRIYLLRMEALLMSVDPTVCIPYWSSSEEQAFPAWLMGFTPDSESDDRFARRHAYNRDFRDASERRSGDSGDGERHFQLLRGRARGHSQLGARVGRGFDAWHPHCAVRSGVLDASR